MKNLVKLKSIIYIKLNHWHFHYQTVGLVLYLTGQEIICVSKKDAENEKIILSVNEVQAVRVEKKKRWTVLFKSFIYWLSQFGAEASDRAGNNSEEETVTAGWYNGISAVSEVQEIYLTG